METFTETEVEQFKRFIEQKNAWSEMSVGDKLQTYGMFKLKKLAYRKHVKPSSDMTKSGLVDLLTEVTVEADLPIVIDPPAEVTR